MNRSGGRKSFLDDLLNEPSDMRIGSSGGGSESRSGGGGGGRQKSVRFFDADDDEDDILGSLTPPTSSHTRAASGIKLRSDGSPGTPPESLSSKSSSGKSDWLGLNDSGKNSDVTPSNQRMDPPKRFEEKSSSFAGDDPEWLSGTSTSRNRMNVDPADSDSWLDIKKKRQPAEQQTVPVENVKDRTEKEHPTGISISGAASSSGAPNTSSRRHSVNSGASSVSDASLLLLQTQVRKE